MTALGLSTGLIVPALVLALLGWLVPRLLSLAWPEGIGPLAGLAFVSAMLMTLIGMAFFAGLYVLQGMPVGVLFEAGWGGGVLHFLRLGAISALIWGPMLVLGVAGVPRTWTRARW